MRQDDEVVVLERVGRVVAVEDAGVALVRVAPPHVVERVGTHADEEVAEDRAALRVVAGAVALEPDHQLAARLRESHADARRRTVATHHAVDRDPHPLVVLIFRHYDRVGLGRGIDLRPAPPPSGSVEGPSNVGAEHAVPEPRENRAKPSACGKVNTLYTDLSTTTFVTRSAIRRRRGRARMRRTRRPRSPPRRRPSPNGVDAAVRPRRERQQNDRLHRRALRTLAQRRLLDDRLGDGLERDLAPSTRSASARTRIVAALPRHQPARERLEQRIDVGAARASRSTAGPARCSRIVTSSAGALERRLAGEHLVDDHAEREQIARGDRRSRPSPARAPCTSACRARVPVVVRRRPSFASSSASRSTAMPKSTMRGISSPSCVARRARSPA